MNQTIRKIEDILTSEYDPNSFIDFIRVIFPTVKIIAPDRFNKEYTNFSSHIEGSFHIGNYVDPEGRKVTLHAVRLKKESYVENSRSVQRGYAKKLMENGGADAAIVAFYTMGDPKWRLSFIRLDYEIKFEAGKLNTETRITPAKRYSYLVGENEPCHTAISRFHQFIIDDNNMVLPTLNDLEDAFSVEAVTKEFFDLYADKYYQLVECLERNTAFLAESKRCGFTTEQFAKKLLGQIVFLYFLQKKGWLGVGVWKQSLTDKEYKDIYYTKKVSAGKKQIVQQYLPIIYSADGRFYKFNGLSALENIPNEIEKLIAEQLPVSEEWSQSLTMKQYRDLLNMKVSEGRKRIISQSLPILYSQEGNYFRFNGIKATSELSEDEKSYIKSILPGPRSWGSGSKTFLRTWFEFAKGHKGDFFDNYLEPLFYATLNKNRGELGYSSVLHCRVPFLSGGLFEPLDGYDWENSFFGIPDEIFSNRESKDDWTADGILDIFDRFNFTMSEDEPMEREVAIDPEMLGKVFENLLDVKDRKQKGAFYTPREIVHYMCQETLINYLVKKTGISVNDIRTFIIYGDFYRDNDIQKTLHVDDETGEVLHGNNIYTRKHHMEFDKERDLQIPASIFCLKSGINRLKDIDDALINIHVADLAVGSGAFPLGMLNEIVRARQNISAYMAITMSGTDTRWMYINQRSPYILKRETIQNCIFAADIEPSAVDIARLRLWLSLVIDDEINPSAQTEFDGHKNPIPLPNLECNIVCGNSLVDEFEGYQLIVHSKQLANSNEGDTFSWNQGKLEMIIPKLIDAQNRLFKCDDPDKKAAIKEELSSLKDLMISTKLEIMPHDILARYYESKNLASLPYVLWQIEFARVFNEKGGFDIVIGNPPYVGEKGNKELFRPIAATEFGHKYYYGKMDLFYFFFHKALDLGNQDAEVSFITTNYYPTAFGGRVLREDFKMRSQVRKLINFNELKIFESALGQHNMITVLTKNKKNPVKARNCICKMKGVANNHMLDEILYATEGQDNYFDYYEVNQSDLYEGSESYIRLTGCGTGEKDTIESVLAKISGSKWLLKDIAFIKQGIVSGADKYTDAHEKKYHLGFPKGMGIFVLHNAEIKSLDIPSEEMGFVKEVYKNSQISKYHINYSDELKVFYITKDIMPQDAPVIIGYLQQFKPILESKREAREGKLPWYSLHWARDRFIFEADEKIVNSRRAKGNIFALETKKCFEQSDLMITVIKDKYKRAFPPKYVLGLLNSRIYYVWLRNKGKLKGDMLELYGAPLEEIPVKEAPDQMKTKIIDTVNKLIKEPDDEILMRELDSMFYDVFDLTEKERQLVEDYDG